ncbi:DegT/DnrJ/EryC1/StrS family aminotransferase [Motiliproteus sediminis]|uniref:DegT/DnrJ/EryC1/StrS family aminotransferase n=1 Tax=Motiliproteus sediminis TaxID=1468178 RepID=UPI001AEFCF5E|nr:DegT/DnrJ/EryC1/StrS family aminotransferase [Motiliproteus sediminis]
MSPEQQENSTAAHPLIYDLPSCAASYPLPKVPMLPQLQPRLLRTSRANGHHSRFLAADTQFFRSGRTALFHALKALNIGPGDEVLVPAYHCGSMLEPIIFLGGKIRLFQLTEKLQILDQHLIPHVNSRTKALLAPHFFGFPQPMPSLQAFCRQHQLALIEDCAHAFFGSLDGQMLGSFGDVAIASTVKFFPGIEGGALVINRTAEQFCPPSLNAAPLSAQLKSVLHTLQMARNYNQPLPSDRDIKAVTLPGPIHYPLRPLNRDEFHWFDPNQLYAAPTWFARALIQHSDCTANAGRRRDNFHYYLDRLSKQPDLRLLFDRLPDAVVPYVFPLFLPDSERTFPTLKLQGVPMWRWEELMLSDCDISKQMRLSLIQLPCHQSMSRQQLDWVIDRLLKAVG